MTPVDSHASDTVNDAASSRFGRRGKWWQACLGAALLVAAICSVYGRVIDAPFICDDYTSLRENPSIREWWPWWKTSGEPSPLRPSPDTPVSARPMVNFTFALNYHFSQMSPGGYRVTNIAIHVVASLILWALVRRTLLLEFLAGRFKRVAGLLGFLSALMWAVHPLNTESIAYITQRTESQMGLCYLATMYFCLRYWTTVDRAPRIGWLIAATIACQLGALSKEMMATLPAVALLYERTFIATSFWRALRRSWPLYIALALAWIPQIVINYHGPRTPSAGFHLGLPAYIWWYTQAEVLLLYLKLSFWPWPLVLHYEIPYKETLAVAWPWVLPVAVYLLGSLYLVWKRTSAGFVTATIVIALSPTLLVPLVGEIVAERRMYVALAALVPLVVAGSYDLVRRLAVGGSTSDAAAAAGRRAMRVILGLWLLAAVVFVVVGNTRLAAYADEVTLLADTVHNQPDDLAMLINLGVALSHVNRHAEALPHFEHADEVFRDSTVLNYRLNQESHKLYYNWGLSCQELDHPDEAMKHYERAIELFPNHAQSHYNLGVLLQQRGLLDPALVQYDEALRINPEFAAAQCNLGALLASAGRYAEAIPYLEKGSRLAPDPENFVNLVDAYALAGKSEEAISAARTAIRLARDGNRDDLAEHIEEWLKTYPPAREQAE